MNAFTTVNLFKLDSEAIVYEAGDIIFDAGETGNEMYAILQGSVGLWVNDQQLEVIHEGDIFGEGALVQPNHQRGSRAIAQTSCQLISLNQNRFLFVCQNTPMFAVEVMRSFSDRLRTLKQQFAQKEK